MRLQIPAAMHHKKYFYYWSGSMISVVGTRMQFTALFWHINTITEEPIALGMVGAARILPVMATVGIARVLGVGIIARIWPQFARYNGDEHKAVGVMAD